MALKVVLVGCGDISRTWLEALKDRPDVEVAGLVDLREEAAKEKAAQFRLAGAVVGTDFAAVLAKTRPGVVFNCATPEAHLPITLAAFDRGCHVMSEKPLADSMESARRMVAAARETGRLFAVMQNSRYDAQARRLRDFLASGAIGRVTTVNSDFYVGAHYGRFRATMEHVLLLDMAIHTFDLGRMIMGADPRSAYCHEWNPAGSWYCHGASAIAIFEMTGDIVFTYRGSWASEGFHTLRKAEWRIVGTNGTALWDGGEGIRAQTPRDNGKPIRDGVDAPVPPLTGREKSGGHAGAINEFLDCVSSGAAPETIASDNIKSLAMVFAAIQSAQTAHRAAITD